MTQIDQCERYGVEEVQHGALLLALCRRISFLPVILKSERRACLWPGGGGCTECWKVYGMLCVGPGVVGEGGWGPGAVQPLPMCRAAAGIPVGPRIGTSRAAKLPSFAGMARLSKLPQLSEKPTYPSFKDGMCDEHLAARCNASRLAG